MKAMLLAIILALAGEEPTYTITIHVQNLCMTGGFC
jgi:hypothetical protein